MEFFAQYYQATGSGRQTVKVAVEDQHLTVYFLDGSDDLAPSLSATSLRYPLADIQISNRIGNTPRWLILPDNNRMEASDNDTIDQLQRQLPKTSSDWVYHLESRWKAVLVFVAIVIVFSWGFTRYGVPVIAKQVAYALPIEANIHLDKETLNALDEWVFQPSQLSEEQQTHYRQLFAELLSAFDVERQFNYQLQFRSSEAIGANAFALPSGTIVFTDDMFALAQSEQEIMAVMAHEIGHVEHRHALRRVVQSSLLPLLIMSVTGDVSSATGVITVLPTLLLEAGYSQEFEHEADGYAKGHLPLVAIDPMQLARILERLSQQANEQSLGFLSTHPPTKERMQRLATPE